MRANSEDGELWFRLEPSTSAAVVIEDGVDLTRSIGTLTLTDHQVEAGLIVDGLQAHRTELIVNTVLAAEASGIAGWALRTAVDYVKSRQQFGRPVGSFQAVQHKAAMMLVRSEIACAAAWDAARSEDHDEDQQKLVSAQAALAALPVGIENALECVTLLGGIGFTWEHDAHLYWRRAISIAAVAGSEVKWAHTLGDRSADSERDFSFVDPEMLPELREQVRGFWTRLRCCPTTEPPAPVGRRPRGALDAPDLPTPNWLPRTIGRRMGWERDRGNRPSSHMNSRCEVGLNRPR